MLDMALKIYCLDLQYIVIIMIVSIVVWALIADLIKHKRCSGVVLLWKIINSILFVCYSAFVLYFTLFRRSEGSHELVLIPFYSFIEAQTNVEMYREMLMNVFLFLPLGLSLPFALPDKLKHKLIVTVLVGFLLSIAIEFSQYYFKLGRAEVDDVIMNTLGTLFGSFSYLISYFILKKRG